MKKLLDKIRRAPLLVKAPIELNELERFEVQVDPKRASSSCLLTPDASNHGDKWLEHLGIPDWESKWDRGAWDPMYGTIAVAEIGCGLFYSLIMNGDYRGRIFSWGVMR